MGQFERTELLVGHDNIDKLQKSKIIIFGVGGVGGFVAEALARSGIGGFTLVDKDTVSESNINRQIIALHSTIGKAKVQVMKERILDINPSANVKAVECFFLPRNSNQFDFSKYDYVIDAVDNVTAKIEIIKKSKEANVPIISSMGTGNKLNPLEFKICDISKTDTCPLARVMRKELMKRGIENVQVLFSKEKPIKTNAKDAETGKVIPGSIAFVPSVAGLVIASKVIKDLIAI